MNLNVIEQAKNVLAIDQLEKVIATEKAIKELQQVQDEYKQLIKKEMEKLYEVYNLEKEGKNLDKGQEFGLSVQNITDQVLSLSEKGYISTDSFFRKSNIPYKNELHDRIRCDILKEQLNN